jgi:hypothetical protein
MFGDSISEATMRPNLRSEAWYWFAQILWLKLAISFLYSVGRASAFEWQLWLIVALGASASAVVIVAPDVRNMDLHVEVVAGLGRIVALYYCSSALYWNH